MIDDTVIFSRNVAILQFKMGILLPNGLGKLRKITD